MKCNMNIQNVKTQLMKQIAFKSKVLRQSQRYNSPSTVELRKDIEALDYAIRLVGEKQKGVKKMDELIRYAERRLNESVQAGIDTDMFYWRAYLDGATAMKKEYEKRMEDDRK